MLDADYQRGGITGRFDPSLLAQFPNGKIEGTTLFHFFQKLYSASDQDISLDIHESRFGVDYVPADPRLSSITEDKLPSSNNIKENNTLLLKHLMVIHSLLVDLKDDYDYILIDSHPEVSALLRAIIFASDYAVSPVKLDLQSSVGVATIIGAIKGVNDDVVMLNGILSNSEKIEYTPTKFAGALGMMTREWAGDLKDTEQTEYRRLSRIGHVFENYCTEGDGIRQAALYRTTVYDIAGANASKQSTQFRKIVKEFISLCP